jgi:glycerophosphoryl diester phosphodiesterase
MPKINNEVPEFWQNDNQIIGVAHRGGDAAGIEKENSLAAFQAAHDKGFRWFETDVVPTKDGKLLAVHGRGLQMHPNKDLPTRKQIQKLTYAESQDLLIGGEQMPLLEDLLDTFPDVKWFIDPKVNNAVRPLVDLLKQKGRILENVSVGSFSQDRTDAVAAEVKEATHKDICTTIGPLGSLAVLNTSDVDRSRISFPDRWALRAAKATRRLPSDAVPATSINVPYQWVKASSNLVEIAHGLGLHIATWTPNEIKDIQSSADKGVDAIMSDRLDNLQSVIGQQTKS